MRASSRFPRLQQGNTEETTSRHKVGKTKTVVRRGAPFRFCMTAQSQVSENGDKIRTREFSRARTCQVNAPSAIHRRLRHTFRARTQVHGDDHVRYRAPDADAPPRVHPQGARQARARLAQRGLHQQRSRARAHARHRPARGQGTREEEEDDLRGGHEAGLAARLQRRRRRLRRRSRAGACFPFAARRASERDGARENNQKSPEQQTVNDRRPGAWTRGRARPRGFSVSCATANATEARGVCRDATSSVAMSRARRRGARSVRADAR